MSDLKFKVVFKGKINDGVSKEKVGKSLCHFLKINPKHHDKLFDGRSYAIKKQLSEEQAQRVKQKLLSIGIISSVVADESQKAHKVETQLETNHKIKSTFWRERFEILDSLPQVSSIFSLGKTQEFKSLDKKSSHKVMFNIYAFIFGAFYYFFKGMWEKGIIILFISMTYTFSLSIIEEVFEFQIYSAIYWVVPSSIIAVIATFDYYKKVSENQRIWPALHSLNKKFILIPIVLISILLCIFPFIDITPASYDRTIAKVKNGFLDYNETTTVGHAFDNWSRCNKSKWSKFLTKNKVNVVEFECITNAGKLMKLGDTIYTEKSLTFQFTLNYDDSFQINSINYSDTLQSGEKKEGSATVIFGIQYWLYLVYSNSDN
ncbi:DUF2628 domain-containing protein [uncultured Pseudoalteromonas sp.]|uniref:DUF2628 domain-containing protein n=1 Tax=uncultured Pseudoalteromonas sp. TaxID=114053 RepID=UPI0025914549|nr:DUF2628 domain-containing protein [uncultured Pseudoalteromonas sp.]